MINSARASVSSASPLELTAIAALVVECFLLSKSNADANTFSFRYSFPPPYSSMLSLNFKLYMLVDYETDRW